jgi:uncharacterized protein (TIGR02265 family)
MMRAMPIEQKAASAVATRVEPDTTEFRFPDWRAPIDLHERLPRTPAEQTVKGMFMQQIIEQARAASGRSPQEDAFLPFQDYPMRAWMELLVRCAELAHPAEPAREGIRRLGQLSYATFSASSAGQVMVELFGGDMSSVLRFVPRYFRLTGRGGIADVSFLAEHQAIVHLRDVWDFPDAYHVGVYEGVMRGVGAKGQVKVRMIGVSGADLEVVWR